MQLSLNYKIAYKKNRLRREKEKKEQKGKIKRFRRRTKTLIALVTIIKKISRQDPIQLYHENLLIEMLEKKKKKKKKSSVRII